MKTLLVIVDSESCAGLLAHPERFCSKGRLKSCAGISNERVRIQGLAAELALSYALSGDALLPPVYRYEASGKPVIDGGFISLSHSGRFAVCAYSDRLVGVDIEALRPVASGIAPRILSPKELDEFSKTRDDHYLLRKFVMKEAFFKMTGEGVSGGFRDLFERDGRLFRRGVLSAFPVFFDSSEYACCAVSSSPFDEIELIDDVALRVERIQTAEQKT